MNRAEGFLKKLSQNIDIILHKPSSKQIAYTKIEKELYTDIISYLHKPSVSVCSHLVASGGEEVNLQLEPCKPLSMSLQIINETNEILKRLAIGDVIETLPSKENPLSKELTNLLQSLDYMTEHAKIIATGDYTRGVEPRCANDTLGESLKTISETLSDASFVAEQVANGELEAYIDVKGRNDFLALSINRMINQLSRITEENNRQMWLSKSQSGLSEALRGDQDLKTLGKNILSYTVNRLEAEVGIIYLKLGNKLKLLASNNFKYRNEMSDEFELTEGYVGQSYYEESTIVLNSLPKKYFIPEGMDEAHIPQTVLLVPIKFNNEILGVIEIASATKFTNDMITFLEGSCENISIAIQASFSKKEKEELFELTKGQTELLEKQKEDLQLQAEKTKIQQEELSKANELLNNQTSELRKNKIFLEAQHKELQVVNEELEKQTESVQIQNEHLSKAHKQLDEKAKELELTNKYKSEFLANMSHELRTPLNSLLLLSESLKENKEQNLTEKQVQIASIINRSGNDLLNLINDILDLAKVESGKMTTFLENINVELLLNDVKDLFKPLIAEKSIELITELDPTMNPIIHSDEQKIIHILRNLISNAIKFTESGSITVIVKKSAEHSGMVDFSVRDTGIGIPEEKQKSIFEAFQQADGSTSRNYGGTGLGLSITTGFTKILGGFVSLKSKEGEGSTFTITLPCEVKKQEETPKKRSRKKNEVQPIHLKNTSEVEKYKNKNVLIVDDDMRNLFALSEILDELECNVSKAFDGYNAIELVEKMKHVDLILMDIMMPGIDGFETTKKIRELDQYKTTPIIAVTAKAMAGDKEKCLQEGLTDYINKPINKNELFNTLNKWM